MLFNSLSFFSFFVLFFLLYWYPFGKTVQRQNILLLAGSYIFYAFTDWRFLVILIVSSLLNFLAGLGIERSERFRRLLFWLGMIQGIGSLIIFKYFNFFISSVNDVFTALHLQINFQLLQVIVPVGISFFTFRTMSYLLDIKKRKIKASTHWVIFFNYVAFFPSLLSGPIDRARTFIPQLEKRRVFDYSMASDGMRQILWGVFKKMVVADNCAVIANDIFSNYQHLPGSSLLIGAFFYTIQMYADFSGYSDMAIGIAKLIGFNVMPNFDNPYFAQNIAEFWRKWHISLTSWLTEYVFTPLSISFRDLGKAGLCIAIIINFSLVGVWHGANWTYIAFGFLHGCYFIPLILRGTMNRKKKQHQPSKLTNQFFSWLGTFMLVMLTFIVFRSESLEGAWSYYKILFSASLFSVPVVAGVALLAKTSLFLLLMFTTEWLNRRQYHGFSVARVAYPAVRSAIYLTVVFLIIWMGADSTNQFIYFNF